MDIEGCAIDGCLSYVHMACPNVELLAMLDAFNRKKHEHKKVYMDICSIAGVMDNSYPQNMHFGSNALLQLLIRGNSDLLMKTKKIVSTKDHETNSTGFSCYKVNDQGRKLLETCLDRGYGDKPNAISETYLITLEKFFYKDGQSNSLLDKLINQYVSKYIQASDKENKQAIDDLCIAIKECMKQFYLDTEYYMYNKGNALLSSIITRAICLLDSGYDMPPPSDIVFIDNSKENVASVEKVKNILLQIGCTIYTIDNIGTCGRSLSVFGHDYNPEMISHQTCQEDEGSLSLKQITYMLNAFSNNIEVNQSLEADLRKNNELMYKICFDEVLRSLLSIQIDAQGIRYEESEYIKKSFAKDSILNLTGDIEQMIIQTSGDIKTLQMLQRESKASHKIANNDLLSIQSYLEEILDNYKLHEEQAILQDSTERLEHNAQGATGSTAPRECENAIETKKIPFSSRDLHSKDITKVSTEMVDHESLLKLLELVKDKTNSSEKISKCEINIDQLKDDIKEKIEKINSSSQDYKKFSNKIVNYNKFLMVLEYIKSHRDQYIKNYNQSCEDQDIEVSDHKIYNEGLLHYIKILCNEQDIKFDSQTVCITQIQECADEKQEIQITHMSGLYRKIIKNCKLEQLLMKIRIDAKDIVDSKVDTRLSLIPPTRCLGTANEHHKEGAIPKVQPSLYAKKLAENHSNVQYNLYAPSTVQSSSGKGAKVAQLALPTQPSSVGVTRAVRRKTKITCSTNVSSNTPSVTTPLTSTNMHLANVSSNITCVVTPPTSPNEHPPSVPSSNLQELTSPDNLSLIQI